MYQEHIDRIVLYFNERFPEELAQARQEYFALTGEIFDDDPFYEQCLANYLNWFVFDRLIQDSPAIHHYLREKAHELNEEDLETVTAFMKTEHSLFEVKSLKPKKQLVILIDLANGQKHEVSERRTVLGLSKGDIFESRLLIKGEKTYFLHTFVHHPKEALGFVRKKMKLYRKEKSGNDLRPFMISLQRLWLQCQRYHHVSPARIYTDETLEKFHGRKIP